MTGKYSGGLTGLLNREREKKVEPAPQVTQVTETQAPVTEVPQTEVRELGQPSSLSAAVARTEVPQAKAPVTQVQKTQVPQSEVGRAAGRFLQVDHAVLDEFLPRLQPYEQLVYLRLFRLTVGFGRRTCTVSHAKLAEKTRLSVSTIKRTCAQLEANGYVRSRAVLGGTPAERGCEFEVIEPAWLFEAQARETQAPRSQARRTQVREAQVPQSDMINRKESHERAAAGAPPGIYEIRTIGARLFERHRTDLGFDHRRLAELVADTLAAQGITPNGELIEEAIKGMAVQ